MSKPSSYTPQVDRQSFLRSSTVAPTPTANAGPTFLESIDAHKESVFKFFRETLSKVDRKSLIVGATIVVTLGLGGAAVWYVQKRRALLKKEKGLYDGNNKITFNLDGSASPVTIRSTRSINCEEGDRKIGVTLHQCPRGRRTPCIAPYPLKLETFLRVSGINYDVSNESCDS
jgi:hypothetical protein